jgi:26S proteasome regulatory subunit N1
MGHEYIRHITAELGEEYTVREGDTLEQPEGENNSAEPDIELPGTIEDLRGLAKQCALFFLDHNAEPDTVDLLEELEIINGITRLVDEITYGRVCQYMIRYVFYTFIFHQTYYLSDV